MNTKNIFKTALLASTFSLSLTGCMNFEPTASLGDGNMWDNADNYQLFSNEFYEWTHDFYSTTTYQSTISDNQAGPHNDLRSDLVCRETYNEYSSGANSIPVADANYNTLYKRIYSCNLLLKNAADRTDVNTPKGEAYFFRAYLYFELLQMYGDVQLILEPLDMESQQLQGTRNNRLEVANQIISDLQQAASLLPTTPTEKGRLCKYAAEAMLSRVALYEGTWQKFHYGADGYATTTNTETVKGLLQTAVDAAKDVIDHGGYSLFQKSNLKAPTNVVTSNGTNINQSYRYMFILEDADAGQTNPANVTLSDNKEYIFEVKHNGTRTIGYNVSGAYAVHSVFVTRKMANMYVCDNGLPIEFDDVNGNYSGTREVLNSRFVGYSSATDEFQNRDPRMDNSMFYLGETYFNGAETVKNGGREDWSSTSNALSAKTNLKTGYYPQKWVAERLGAAGTEMYSYPVIRYAEVLLNYAEAEYELNNGITAEELTYSIDKLRQRVGFSTDAYLSKLVDKYPNLDMRKEIRRERTVELFLEGFRIDDLKRWYTAGMEMPEPMLGVKYDGTAYAEADGWIGSQDKALHGDTHTAKCYSDIDSKGCIIYYSDRNWAEKNYLLPLPAEQTNLNPSLGQNPGWQ